MINIVSKSGSFGPYLKTTSQAVASQIKPLVNPVTQPKHSSHSVPPPALTSYSLNNLLLTGNLRVKSGLSGKNFRLYISNPTSFARRIVNVIL